MMNTIDEVIEAFSEANKEVCCGDCQFNDTESDDIPCEMNDCIFNDALYYLKEYQRYQNTPSRNGHMALVDYFEESQKNEPLTWDELKLMEGKPVWVEADSGIAEWCLVDRIFDLENDILIGFVSRYGYIERSKNLQDVVWQAYRKERR